jgi:hypothetical protein
MQLGIKIGKDKSGDKRKTAPKPNSINETFSGIGSLKVIENVIVNSQTVQQVRITVGRMAIKKADFLNLNVIDVAIYCA